MSRFSPLNRGSGNHQLIDWNDPGDFRKRDPSKSGSRFAGLAEALRPGGHIDQSKRLPAFRTDLAATAAKKTTVPVKAKVTTKETLEQAVQFAKSQARARVKIVTASDAYRGRAKQGNALLMASCDRNAKFKDSTQIIAELAKRPTDAELAAQSAAAKQARIESAWDGAINRMCRDMDRDNRLVANNQPRNSDRAAQSSTDGVWEAAIRKVHGDLAQTSPLLSTNQTPS